MFNSIMSSMNNWKVEVIVGGKYLAKVSIQKGIFQGDSWFLQISITVMTHLNDIIRKSKEDIESQNHKKK